MIVVCYMIIWYDNDMIFYFYNMYLYNLYHKYKWWYMCGYILIISLWVCNVIRVGSIFERVWKRCFHSKWGWACRLTSQSKFQNPTSFRYWICHVDMSHNTPQDLVAELTRPGNEAGKRDFLAKRNRLIVHMQNHGDELPKGWTADPLQLLDC